MTKNVLAYLRLIFNLSNFYFILITALLVIEIELFTIWRTIIDPHTLVFYFFGVQLMIGILPLLLVRNKQFIKPNSINLKRAIPLSIIAVSSIFYAFTLLKPLYDKVIIRVSDSDIIPQIQRFCKEMVAGRFPYTPFDDFGYRMSPTYLPTQWLPYLPIEFFKIDPRYISSGILALVFLVFSVKIIKNGLSFFSGALLMAMPVLLISLVIDHDSNIWSVTVEQLIMAYYLLLGISLTTTSRAFQVAAIVLCLMSRFSLLFWLPLFVFMVWTKEGTRATIKFSAWILAGCAVIYGPFLLKDPHIFSNAQAYYDLATERCWTSDGKPTPIYHGLAFAIYFFEKTGDKVLQVAALKKYFLIITPSVSLLFGWIWWRYKDKFDFSLFAVCSLKISLAVFYAFISIPFSYLYVTPIIMSLVVLYRFGVLIKNKVELETV
jgi:hypothetical protein